MAEDLRPKRQRTKGPAAAIPAPRKPVGRSPLRRERPPLELRFPTPRAGTSEALSWAGWILGEVRGQRPRTLKWKPPLGSPAESMPGLKPESIGRGERLRPPSG